MLLLLSSCLCFTCLLAFAAAAAEDESPYYLTQLHVVTRHGSRTPLTKNATTLTEHTPGMLTPLGQQQMFQVGVWLRERYPDFYFQNNHHLFTRLESSALERTMVSANFLAQGLYNNNDSSTTTTTTAATTIPVYSKDLRNDVTIRSYDKCPRFLKRLNALYASPEWKDLENNHIVLLQKLASIPQFEAYADDDARKMMIPLQNVWNVFDIIHVAKTECSSNATSFCSDSAAQLANIVSIQEWMELQMLAHTAEILKFGPQTAQKLVGGNLAFQIISSMQQEQQDSNDLPKFYLYSAHYPTILGLLAAWNIYYNEVSAEEVIPNCATALVLELYESKTDKNEKTVKIWYKDGDSNALQVVSLRPEDCSDTTVSAAFCPLDTLQRSLGNNYSVEQWCNECENDSADVCLQAMVHNNNNNNMAAAASCSSGTNPFAFLLGGFVAGLILAVALSFIWTQRRRRINVEKKSDTEVSNNEPPVVATSSASYA